MKRKLLMAAIVAVASAIGGGSSAFAQKQGEAFKFNGVRYEVTGENLITNNSFEEGFRGWTSSNDFKTELSADNFVIKTEGAQDGDSYLVGKESKGATNAASLGTGWDIETNKTYVFSYYIRYNVEESEKGNGNDTQYLKTTLVNTKGGNEGTLGTTQPLGEPTVSKDGEWCQFQTVFTNEEYAYLQISFRWLENQWGFDNFVLAEVAPRTKVIDEDYADLQAAIDNIEQNLGFEAGEYAPYNVPFETLNEAKALVAEQNATALSDIVELIEALEAVKANEEEVNAIFDGTFVDEKSSISGRNIRPLGWYLDETKPEEAETSDCRIRYVSLTTSSGNTGLNATSSHNGMMLKTTAYYGYDEQYALPLKGDTYYSFTFKMGTWNENHGARKVYVINPAGEKTLVKTVSFTATNGHTNADVWQTVTATFKTGEAGNYQIGFDATYSGNSQNQTACGDITLVKSTSLPELADEIEKANALAERNVGDAAFQIPADAEAVKALKEAIETAQGVYDNPQDDAAADAAAVELQKAETTYEAAYSAIELNKPAEGEVFNIINVSAGYTPAGKALTFKSAKDAKVENNNIAMAWSELPGSIYPQDVTFEPVDDEVNTYTLSYTRADGTPIYIATGQTAGASGGNYDNIRATSDSEKALKVKVAVSDKENTWYLHNTENNNKRLGGNGKDDANLFTGEANSHPYYDMQLSPAAKHEVAVSLSDNYATLVVPFEAEIPEGLEVYSIANAEAIGEDGVLTLTPEEESIKANTPYVVYGSEDTTVAGYGVAYTTSETFENGLLAGSYYAFDVPANSYVLQTQGEEQAFYQTTAKLNGTAYRAYLTVPNEIAGIKAFYFNFADGDATAIKAVPEVAEGAEKVFYNLAGQRVANPTKGIYIVNGQKVLVK